jgi:cell division protease FtsH
MYILILLVSGLYYTHSLEVPRQIRYPITDSDIVQKIKPYLHEDQYTNLVSKIKTHKVSELYFTPKMDVVVSHNTETTDNPILDYSVTTVNPAIVNSIVELADKNELNTVFLKDPPQNDFVVGVANLFNFALNSVFPILILVSIFRVFSMNQSPMGGGGFGPNMGKKTQINVDKLSMQQNNITLSSFAGSEEIMRECTEVVSYLKNSTLYEMAGAKIPRGILLEGPPGSGKTLLAKAIASEAEANFIATSGSEFVEIFVGMGASKIRNLFETARTSSPCIIFIDEIDAVGRQRGAGINMANDEREQTLNQLLSEMDGFADNDGIMVIAATNRKDVLDAALLRPGRFDRIITVPYPDRESRKSILEVHATNKKLDENINLDYIAELTAGFSGAQLKNLLNEAAIYAVRNGSTMITEANIVDALEKLIVGIVKTRDERSPDSLKRVAIHEIGHAFLAAHFKEYFDLKKVTIQSTYNGAGGYTLFNEYLNITESGLYTKDLLLKRLIVTMGGKAAETIFYGNDYVSVGAVQDLKQANSLAKRMIGNYGMGNKLEAFYNENVEDDRNPFLGRSLALGSKYSERTKDMMDRETLELVTFALNEAKNILMNNQQIVSDLVDCLFNNTTLTGSEVFQKMNV